MKFSDIQLLLLHVAAAAAADTTDNISSPPIACLASGPIFGVTAQLPGAPIPVNKFLGIPYAAKPVRFALSRPPLPWSAPRNATTFGNSCYQLGVADDLGGSQELIDTLFNLHHPASEDCLFINAFAPANIDSSVSATTGNGDSSGLGCPYRTTSPVGSPGGRPVLFFIHGGAWTLGEGRFDLSGFAAHEDIVVFSFNYRLNDEIPVQQRNLGMFDQQLALQWVRDNARAFGGDPSKITIWGFSAGSVSVDMFMHTYANATNPPFRAAIMMSGEWSFGMFSTLTRNPNDTSSWDAIAKAAGCKGSKIQCLRQLSSEQLLNATIQAQAFNYLPILDNKAIPFGRAKAWRQGNVAKVPLLGGTSAEEGRSTVSLNISLDRFNQNATKYGQQLRNNKQDIQRFAPAMRE
ncbi:hypothetical protein E4U42_007127 [Claviceps africana]|uniref:Carboxylic ester hydrolase n=1 Tax=Claviceps africana TaxID=83212 RepID=A0A8K0J249_9HYPO|nr:hypothetical protein E4U42_007127 [Claviceps africana]